MIRVAAASLAARHRLVGAAALGLLAWAALVLVPNDLRWSTRAIVAWDAGCLAFIASSLTLMAGETTAQIRARAARQDEGRGMILALVSAAAAASLAAIAAELSFAQQAQGWPRALHVALGVATVAASWFLSQLIYALHYAHEYYGAADGAAVRGGLAFPGDEDPDYWDFLHFAVVIGVAAQTADVAFTSRAQRRIGTVHSVFAFTFNTVVLALAISLVAGLF